MLCKVIIFYFQIKLTAQEEVALELRASQVFSFNLQTVRPLELFILAWCLFPLVVCRGFQLMLTMVSVLILSGRVPALIGCKEL